MMANFIKEKTLEYQQHLDILTSLERIIKQHKDTLKRIIHETEQHLISLPNSPELTTRLYNTFVTDNGITNHTPLPELQTKMNTTSQKTRSQRRHQQRRHQHRKRKQDKQPQSVKKAKMEHFLSIGHIPTHPPT